MRPSTNRCALVVCAGALTLPPFCGCNQERDPPVCPEWNFAESPVIFRVTGIDQPLYGWLSILVRGNGAVEISGRGTAQDYRHQASFSFSPQNAGLEPHRGADGSLDLAFDAANEFFWISDNVAQVNVTLHEPIASDGATPRGLFVPLRHVRFHVGRDGNLSLEAHGPDSGRFLHDRPAIAPGDDVQVSATGRIAPACEADPTYATDPRCRELLTGWPNPWQ